MYVTANNSNNLLCMFCGWKQKLSEVEIQNVALLHLLKMAQVQASLENSANLMVWAEWRNIWESL